MDSKSTVARLNQPSPPSLVWVGIASSAGGLEALQAMVAALPTGVNATYIVAQHLSPKHRTMMVTLLQRNTKLSVCEASNGTKPEPNTIYITPPNRDVSVENGCLRLTLPRHANAPKPSADILFASMADEFGEHSIGVVLSGTGSDGARGIKALRAAGGICIAQDPQSAKYDGMPHAAIDTGCVDVVLGPDEIAQHIGNLVIKFPTASNLIDPDASHRNGFAELLELIFQRTRVNLKDYKKATIKRRLERRMLARGIGLFDDYLNFVRGNQGELDLLFQDILISVTEFYRDKKAFDELQSIVRGIVEHKAQQQPIRVWVVGCATGEEVYTVAMLFAEAFGGPHTLSEHNLQFFATDIDAQALTMARKGTYPASSALTLPEPLRERYLRNVGDTVEVIKAIRDLVLFSKHNAIADPPFMRIDLLCCRNMLIYFESELQKRIYHLFHYALLPDGHLFLGKSESTLQTAELFKTIDGNAKIFQKRSVAFEHDTPALRARHFQMRSSPSSVIDLPPAPQKREGELLFEGLVSKLADAAVLVNENLDIDWIYGDWTPFVKMRAGRPRMNLGDMVGDAHQDEVRALTYKAVREARTVEGLPRKNKLGGELHTSQAIVYPVQLDKHGGSRVLVAFRKLVKIDNSIEAGTDEGGVSRVRELEEELAAAREHLQTVVEELETSNEELQSVNEELQSANEELQSTNEELETANEELQSTNEELLTVNDELNAKTNDLEKLSLKLRQIENSLDFPLIVVDLRGQLLSANEAAEKHFSINAERHSLATILPEFGDVARIRKLSQLVTETGKIRTMHFEGGKRAYWLRILPYRLADGTVGGAVHTFIDYTARRNVERELAAARVQAEAANDAKSTFMANISHDIRTPLSAIMGGIYMLRNIVTSDEKRDKLLAMVDRSAGELKHLTNEFLNFAKIEAGKLEVVDEEIDIRELIDQVVETVSLVAEGKGLLIKATCSDNVPQHVIGDGLKIRQILLNLVSNAVKFTHDGEVTVAALATRVSKRRVHLEIRVRDTGMGIPTDQLSTIFDKFTQASPTIATRFGGTGLGLNICRELCKLIKATLSVTSTEGKGSEFLINLVLPVADERSHSLPSRVLPKDAAPIDMIGKPLLLVEDNRENVTVLGAYLEHLGYRFELATTGRQAIELYERGHHELILMDLHLPDISGFEVTDHVLNFARSHSLPTPRVVASTAHVQPSIAEQAKKVGMRGFLAKPIHIDELRSVLELSPSHPDNE